MNGPYTKKRRVSFSAKLARAKRISKSTGPTEDEIHVRVVARLREAGLGPTDFFHCPNGGRVSKPEAGRRYARGVAAGVPDLIFTKPSKRRYFQRTHPERVPCACNGPCTCVSFQGDTPAALELKKPGGRVSAAQKAWLEAHAARGWSVAVAYGEAEAIAILENWGYL